jgi:hypothetical protein
MQAVGRKNFQGQEHFIVKQPDGSYALLPCWMCSPEVEQTKIISRPCISITALKDLNRIISCDLLSFDPQKLTLGLGDQNEVTKGDRRNVESINEYEAFKTCRRRVNKSTKRITT